MANVIANDQRQRRRPIHIESRGLRQRIKSLIEPPNDEWQIIDSHNDLHLLHYLEAEDPSSQPTCADIRGTLVDDKAGVVVARSYGYTPVALLESLPLEQKYLELVDTGGQTHRTELARTTFRRVFEGVVLRVIKHAGVVYYLTHKKIITNRSRWGSSSNFQELYHRAGGPAPESLFAVDRDYSPWCYVFLVVDPSLVVASRQVVTAPYVVHLATNLMWSGTPYPADSIDLEERVLETVTTLPGRMTTPLIHRPQPLSLIEADDFLRYGYYHPLTPTEPRLTTGEALLMTTDTGALVKIHSPSYEWRAQLRGNDPNLYHRFHLLTEYGRPDLNDPTRIQEFLRRFILFPPYGLDDLDRARQPAGLLNLALAPVLPRYLRTRQDRYHIIWINFVVSLPLYQQEQGLTLLAKYQADYNRLVKWLTGLYIRRCRLVEPEYHRSLRTLVGRLRVQLVAQTRTGSISAGEVETAVGKLLDQESAPSIYSYVKCMKRIEDA